MRCLNNFLAPAAVLMLWFSGCGLVTNVINQPSPTLTAPVDLVGPIPTPERPSEHLDITLSSRPLSGQPPFTAPLAASLSYDLQQTMLIMCRQLIWNFGDGVRVSQPCPRPSDEPIRLETVHTYEQPGHYFVRVQMDLADGRVVESSQSQAIVVANPQPVTTGSLLVYWITWGLALAAAGLLALWLARRPRRQAATGCLLLGLVLMTYVPPFSYLPDPLGLYWGLLGGHSYDPRLPFANRFVTAGDPTRPLRPYLDALIGQTGLDPLDPVQPLAAYDFVRVANERFSYNTLVGVRFIYADGSQRIYDVPLHHPKPLKPFYQRNWQYDGLGRLRTEHLEMPGIAFAGEDSSVTLAVPQPVSAPQPELNTSHGYWLYAAGCCHQPFLWSPQGDAFLVKRYDTLGRPALWLVTPDGDAPRRLATAVTDYTWTPDGQAIIFIGMDFFPTANGLQARLHRVSREGGPAQLVHILPHPVLPAVGNEGVGYVERGALWFAPYDGREPYRLTNLPQSAVPPIAMFNSGLVRLSPDAQRVAYSCDEPVDWQAERIGYLCLQDIDGQHWTQMALDAPQIALSWRVDGQQLAVTQWDYQPDRPVLLMILERDGRVKQQIHLAPEGQAAGAQWLADGRRLLVPVYPWGGRRILLVDSESGDVLDLSQPRWDTFFDLHPDGRTLLLSNGRGGFWLSSLIVNQ